ncbi:hypothetical protein [Pseudonocardia sp. MH-G8]|uniref:hypothetical protein n=1 Tax=Pseudonocardia sp. MH-G8 TaxID=1854588 RepID=UPI000BA14F9F|nr:hypothetical protein [Pseudonocardia sp. MH-G8]OZM82252.1 hypothetical protein CFP66_10740 [Pseudonocardia sp. MH-G8]
MQQFRIPEIAPVPGGTDAVVEGRAHGVDGTIGTHLASMAGVIEESASLDAAVATGTSGFAVVSGGDELLSVPVPVVREPDSGGLIGTGFEGDAATSLFVVEGDMVMSAVLSTAAAKELTAKRRLIRRDIGRPADDLQPAIGNR